MALELWRQVSPVGSPRSLEENGLTVGRIAKAVLAASALETAAGTARLARVRGEDLGLGPQATVREFCERAPAFGLRLCRPETALALRETYLDQPRGEVLWLGTTPLRNPGGEPGYFTVGHDSRGRWLCFGCGGPDCSWGRWRRATLAPSTQEWLVPLFVCECPWSRRADRPVWVVFERP